MALNAKQERFVQEARIWSGPPAGFYVYVLVDPRDGSPLYVGKGRGRRALTHWLRWKRGREPNGAKAIRFADIAAAGEEPVVKVIADGLSEEEAYRRERELIAEYRDLLSNLAGGIYSAVESERLRAEADLRRIKPFARWRAERNPDAAQVDLYHRIVDALARLAARARAARTVRLK